MLLVIAFCVAWVVCVGAWIYALVEHGRLRRADGRVFTSGLLVHRFRDPELWQVRGSAQLSTFDLPAGRVVPLSAERIGFLPSVGGAFELRS
jgi:hypothetical protein